jgi:hypothetical protein
MVRSRIIAITLATAALTGLAGCSDDAIGGGNGTGLLAALGKVRATDSTRQWVEYGNVVAAQVLADQEKRFLGLTGFGMGNLRNYARAIPEELGFDPLRFREAVSAGSPPDTTAIAWGDYDVNAVNAKLAEFGIERSDDGDATTWSASPDGSIRIDSPLVQIAGPNTLNNVRTAPGSFAFAARRDTLSWVTDPGDDTLAEDPAMKSVAECLGTVIAAIISRDGRSTMTIGVGVRASSPTEVTDVICVAPGDRDPASIRDNASRQLAEGQSAVTARPWSELLPDAKVEVAGDPSYVRLTANPGADNPPGRVIQMLMNRDLNFLLGLEG